MERTEFGHKFTEHGPTDQNPDQPIGWVSTDGNRVVITPPSATDRSWRVWVPHMEKPYSIIGEGAEERAFSTAALFVEQQTSPRPPTSDQSNTTS